MKNILFGTFVILVLVTACIPSVNPFYTDKDVVTDPRFAGAWIEDENTNNPTAWKFEVATNNVYAVTLTGEKDKMGKFEGHLFKLGKKFFLDLTPTECNYATNQAGMVGVAMIPGHLLVRVSFVEKKLSLGFCNPDWIKKFLKKNPSAIAHRAVDEGIILTAETGALQKFIMKHLGKDELFSDGTGYSRQINADPPK